MDCRRMLVVGVVLLAMGAQFRLVERFVLNERASQFIEKRLEARRRKQSLTQYTSSPSPYDDTWVDPALAADPALAGAGLAGGASRKTIRVPRWLGWSLVSVGAVLILTAPCFRRG